MRILRLIILLFCFKPIVAFSNSESLCLGESSVIECFEEYRNKVDEKSMDVAWYFSKGVVEGWIRYISGDRSVDNVMDSVRVIRNRSTFVSRMCEIYDIRYDVDTNSSGRLNIISLSCSTNKPYAVVVNYTKENDVWVISLVTYKADRNICWKPPLDTPRLCDALVE